MQEKGIRKTENIVKEYIRKAEKNEGMRKIRMNVVNNVKNNEAQGRRGGRKKGGNLERD